MKKILIIGATSVIAQETARLYCREKTEFYLVSRNEKRLQIVGEDLLALGAKKVTCLAADPVSLLDGDNVIKSAITSMGIINIALISQGDLPDQKTCKKSIKQTVRTFMLNSLSVITIATSIANQLEKQRKGSLVVLSSVAGERCHAGNYVHATIEASLSTFLQGLRYRFKFFTSINIINIKMAFVDTPMTENFQKNCFWSQPEDIAKGIKKAIQKEQSSVVYLPWFWFFYCYIFRLIPQRIIKQSPL